MMKIKFTKDTKDIRPNRGKTIKKGTTLECTDELGDEYIKMKAAKKQVPDVVPITKEEIEKELENEN